MCLSAFHFRSWWCLLRGIRKLAPPPFPISLLPCRPFPPVFLDKNDMSPTYFPLLFSRIHFSLALLSTTNSVNYDIGRDFFFFWALAFSPFPSLSIRRFFSDRLASPFLTFLVRRALSPPLARRTPRDSYCPSFSSFKASSLSYPESSGSGKIDPGILSCPRLTLFVSLLAPRPLSFLLCVALSSACGSCRSETG